MVSQLGNPYVLLINSFVLLGMVALNGYLLGMSLQEKRYYVLFFISIGLCLIGFYYLQMYMVDIGWLEIKEGMMNMSHINKGV